MNAIAKLYCPNLNEEITLKELFRDLHVQSDSESEVDENEDAWLKLLEFSWFVTIFAT